MKRLSLLLAGLALLFTTATAMATPLTGSINFSGALNLTGATSPVDTQSATGIKFDNPAYVMNGSTGSYGGIKTLTEVTFSDFSFDPTLTLTTPLWTLTSGTDTFDFLMNSVTAIRTAPNALLLNGVGVLQGTGYEDTLGTWSLTTQDGVSGILSFSATSAPVPEPATMLLLGAGFLGLSIYGKRRKNA